MIVKSMRRFFVIYIIAISSFIKCWPNQKLICNLSNQLIQEIRGYQGIVNQIVNEITDGRFKGKTFDSLEELTELFGSRMSCSEGLERAIDYAVAKMKEGNLENVHTERVLNIPNWKRGFESAQLLKPWLKNLQIFGLGTTIGTSIEGITANVAVFENFEEFRNSTENVEGKIVLFTPKWTDGNYRTLSMIRQNAAKEASMRGAIASLVKSITPFSIGSPHTGSQKYDDNVKKIPVASITVEDSEMLSRMYKKGVEILINLKMYDYNEPNCESRNTIGELLGRESLDENVVVLSGHFDSWDVGVGAMDDGGGSMISWKAVEFLKAMGLRPRRTIRSILWTSEELGCIGSRSYHKDHKTREATEFNFLMESDAGTFNPLGLDFSGNAEASCIMKEILNLMKPYNMSKLETPSYGAPDLMTFRDAGFPVASLLNENEKYFYYHHTAGDAMTVWKDKKSLDKCTALFAASSYVIADLSINIPKDLK